MDQSVTRRRALGILGALTTLPLLAEAAPTRAEGAVVPPAAPGAPDGGNLYQTLKWVDEVQQPALSFLHPRFSSLESWKAEARPALQRSLAFEVERGPATAEVLGTERRDGFRMEALRIHASPAYSIPARLLIPEGRRGRLPAVVALHCHGGEYHWGWAKTISSPDDPPTLVEYRGDLYGRPYAEVLARRGFVVIAIDAMYFGDRRLRADSLDPHALPAGAGEWYEKLPSLSAGSADRIRAENRIAGAYEQFMEKALFAAGTTWPGLLTWDDRRTIDYLQTRPEVDPERIGCMGLSGGGLRSALLCGADPRVRAAVVTCWMTTWAPMVAHHAHRHTWMAFTPGMKPYLDLPDASSLLAPGALMVQQATRDTLFPDAGKHDAVEKLAAVYRKASIPERFSGRFYDEPHSFRPGMQEDAFNWMEHWL